MRDGLGAKDDGSIFRTEESGIGGNHDIAEERFLKRLAGFCGDDSGERFPFRGKQLGEAAENGGAAQQRHLRPPELGLTGTGNGGGNIFGRGYVVVGDGLAGGGVGGGKAINGARPADEMNARVHERKLYRNLDGEGRGSFKVSKFQGCKVSRLQSSKFQGFKVVKFKVRRQVALVLDFDEVEALGRSGGTGGAAVAGFEDGEDVGGGDAALADEEEGSDKVADHVVEEAAAANDVDEFFGAALEVRLVDGADVGGAAEIGGVFTAPGLGEAEGAFGIDGGKGGEIVDSGDESGSLLHGVLIQGIGVVSDVTGKKGRNYVAAPDAVVIALGEGGVAGVEFRGHLIGGEDADGGGKTVIEDDAEVCDRNGAGGLKGRDLGEGMDAGVGASGALGQKLLSGEALDGLRQGTLDGGLAGLDLPAVKGGAIIGEGEFESARVHGVTGLTLQGF